MENPIKSYFDGNDLPPSVKELSILFPDLYIYKSTSFDAEISLEENRGGKMIHLFFSKNKILLRLFKIHGHKWERTKIINSEEEFYKIKDVLINFILCPTNKLPMLDTWNEEIDKKEEWGKIHETSEEERYWKLGLK